MVQLPLADGTVVRWEDEGCVLYCVDVLCLLLLFSRCVWCFSLASFERGVSLRMREAYPTAKLLMCCGEPLCCWIRSRLGSLQRDGWLRETGSMFLFKTIGFIGCVRLPGMQCRWIGTLLIVLRKFSLHLQKQVLIKRNEAWIWWRGQV